MNDLERRFLTNMKKLKGGRYLAMIAILHAMNGFDALDPVEGCTRGDFKRAVRFLRETQTMFLQFSDDFENAVMLIRRDWLHREDAA